MAVTSLQAKINCSENKKRNTTGGGQSIGSESEVDSIDNIVN